MILQLQMNESSIIFTNHHIPCILLELNINRIWFCFLSLIISVYGDCKGIMFIGIDSVFLFFLFEQTVPLCQNLYRNSFTYHCLADDKVLQFDDAIQFLGLNSYFHLKKHSSFCSLWLITHLLEFAVQTNVRRTRHVFLCIACPEKAGEYHLSFSYCCTFFLCVLGSF